MSRLFSPDRSRSAALTLAFLLILCGSLTLRPAAAVPTPTKLYELNGTNGSLPYGDLLYDAASRAYYGMTSAGGSSGKGMVFKLKADGTFDDLHDFTGGSDDGSNPNGSLALSGTTLYGMTTYGGTYSNGIVFKVSTSGTGFAILHLFTNDNDGANPYGSLVLSGSTLYGMTSNGGSSGTGMFGKGTVFKVSTSGTGYTILHSFKKGSDDGYRPNGSLVVSGSILYGMTTYGGSLDGGVVFSLPTNATAATPLTLLHSFASVSDGSNPNGSFVLSDTTLYGMTSHGGTSNYGVVFKISTNGTGFTVLHSFTATDDSGNNADGGSPQGSLVLGNSTLYGMTKYGGSSGKGVVFRVSASGTGFVVLHSFTNDSDGSRPCGSLVLNGSSLYGMASGDSPSGKGVVFSLPAAGGTITTLHSFTGGSE